MSSYGSKSKCVCLITLAILLLGLNAIIPNSFYSSHLARGQSVINGLSITHGVSSGDVTNHSAIIWSRANQGANMHVDYDTNANLSHAVASKAASANKSTDFTGHARLDGLKPDTVYFYRVWFSNPDSSVVSASMMGAF